MLVCIIAYDYFLSASRTFYSRTLFFMFPDKLNRLKSERNEIANLIKEAIKKHIHEIDPVAAKNRIIIDEDSSNEHQQIAADSVQFLNRRFSERKERKGTNPELLKEIEIISNNQDK